MTEYPASEMQTENTPQNTLDFTVQDYLVSSEL